MGGKRAPRVLMTADTADELARALGERGVRVAIATMGAPVAEHQRAALAGCEGVELFESSFRLEWMQDPWDDVNAAGEWLMALERDLRPDLLHLNQFSFGFLPFRAPKLVVAHSCVASWWREMPWASSSWTTRTAAAGSRSGRKSAPSSPAPIV